MVGAQLALIWCWVWAQLVKVFAMAPMTTARSVRWSPGRQQMLV
jgi:hypothetical protein